VLHLLPTKTGGAAAFGSGVLEIKTLLVYKLFLIGRCFHCMCNVPKVQRTCLLAGGRVIDALCHLMEADNLRSGEAAKNIFRRFLLKRRHDAIQPVTTMILFEANIRCCKLARAVFDMRNKLQAMNDCCQTAMQLFLLLDCTQCCERKHLQVRDTTPHSTVNCFSERD